MPPISEKMWNNASDTMFQYQAIGVMLFLGFIFTVSVVWWVLKTTSANSRSLQESSEQDKLRILKVLEDKEVTFRDHSKEWHETVRTSSDATIQVARAVDTLTAHIRQCVGRDCPIRNGKNEE